MGANLRHKCEMRDREREVEKGKRRKLEKRREEKEGQNKVIALEEPINRHGCHCYT